jgi:tetratricopeptide (TPR) repeat protein
MKSGLAPKLRALAVIVCASMACSAASAAVQDKQQANNDAPKISEGEQKAIDKIKSASGVAEKLKASTEYLKKNGKSQMRPRVAAYVSDEIAKVADHNQRIGFAENFTKTFNQVEEGDLVKPTLIDSLIATSKFEEAFNEGSKYVERKPDDVIVLTMLATAGANQASIKIQSSQAPPAGMLQKASDAGSKAVELLEADKKPEQMDATFWSNFRNAWLPRLYSAQGTILFVNKDKVAARDKLEKAVGLDPYDLSTLLMLRNIVNEEYMTLAERYQTEKKQAVLNEALQKMDELIDWLARAAAVTEGNAQHEAINKQIMEQLNEIYTFRHNGKPDGLKELIQKYKKP